jgi:hypothetical protein
VVRLNESRPSGLSLVSTLIGRIPKGALAAAAIFTALATASCNQLGSRPGETVEPPANAKLPDGRQRAFPTAEGFGAAAKGGRGGRAIHVTTLAEGGEGSLRACIEAKGPRTCVFRVAGAIRLDKSSLEVREPYLTIAGETAPGGGVAIRNGGELIQPSIEIFTHDVIIRHLRLRAGPHTVESCCAGALGLYTKDAHDIMLDHISASWGSDETVDSEDATDFTWQWSVASEPLLNGGPGKSGRARNMLFTKGGNITVHHSLFAMGKFRNPQIKMKDEGSIADIVNNVMYSPEWEYVISFGDEWAHINANVVGNYKAEGENLINDRLIQIFEESGRGFSIFAKDNFDETYMSGADADTAEAFETHHRQYLVAERHPAPEIATTSPLEAYDAVLAGAGATKPTRDEVDKRIAYEVRTRAGEILGNNPDDVGGWPELEPGVPYEDADLDGVSDEWERKRRLDPNDASDGSKDDDGDGWTNLEEFLHELAGDYDRRS